MSKSWRTRNATFMKAMLKEIKGRKDHPLRFLIDPATGNWRSRGMSSQEPTVQAGHLMSKRGRDLGLGGEYPERLALEDSLLNQFFSGAGESKGAIFFKTAIDVEGIPVEQRSLALWAKQIPALVKYHVAKQEHPGWT